MHIRKRATIIQIFVGIALFILFGLFHQKIFAAALVIAGNSPYCAWQRSLGSIDVTKLQEDLTGEMLAQSHMVSKTTDGIELWDTPLGRYHIPAGSVKEILYDLAEQKRGLYSFNGRGVRPGDVVLDCGANVGVYTRVALKAGARTVVAIEPAPENVECLRRNLATEIADQRVIVYPKGVWDKDDVLSMNIDPRNSAGDSFVIQRAGSHQIQLPLTTIDKLVAELRLESVDFVKFDIEGAERRALDGAKNTLARFHPRMAVAVYHLPDDPQVIPGVIQRGWPNYRMECGTCLVSQTRIVPEVYFFY